MPLPFYEKLGVFYLGRPWDAARAATAPEPLLYDSSDLVTHAVCVGMTGSGKTGLGIGLLEEAALDGIPSLVVDPKGDLANLLLTFPDLAPGDFLPWIDEDAARRAGVSSADYARQQADLWKSGLAQWDEDGERIARLRAAADFVVFTPGSSAGLPLSILSSLAVPPAPVMEDDDLLRERVQTVASSLLSLLGIAADPLTSREHILLANLFEHEWRAGRSLDLAGLIHAIQQPGFTRVGVLDLDTFFPAGDRFGLAMKLNNLLAAPGMEGWFEGTRLDIDKMLYTPSGKPRVAVVSIAHLADEQRMTFVSLLLNETLGWMRGRPGTSSLRAVLYMDEIAGYLPPVANPPSKAPFLTLLKQARAFGLGLVLATQNPVDLDYKGLSNAGTWFLGRLQTERDKLRVLDGLEGAAASAGTDLDRPAIDRLLSGLGKRVFLLHNVHAGAPVLFQTRWTLSYLAGPMTRLQIKRLMDPRRAEFAAGGAGAGAAEATAVGAAAGPAGAAAGSTPEAPATPTVGAPAAPPPATPAGAPAGRPMLPPDVPQAFLPIARTGGGELVYEPRLLGAGNVRFVDDKRGLDHTLAVVLLAAAPAGASAADWYAAVELDVTVDDLGQAPEATAGAAGFADLPRGAADGKSYSGWGRELADVLSRTRKLELFRSPGLGVVSNPGESERDFRIRLGEAGREERDRQKEALRKKYAPRVAALEERVRKADLAVDREREQAHQKQLDTAISFGATALTALFGGKLLSRSTLGRATTAARGVSRSIKEGQDAARAAEDAAALRAQHAELEAQLQAEIDQLDTRLDPQTETLETIAVKPKKTDVDIRLVTLAWAPSRRQPDGTLAPAWD